MNSKLSVKSNPEKHIGQIDYSEFEYDKQVLKTVKTFKER